MALLTKTNAMKALKWGAVVAVVGVVGFFAWKAWNKVVETRMLQKGFRGEV